MCECVRAYIYMCIFTSCIFMQTYLRNAYLRIHITLPTRTPTISWWIATHTRTHTYIHVHIFTYICIHIYTYTGFYSADPHPGNILVDRHTKKAVLLDFGLVKELDLATRYHFAKLLVAAAEQGGCDSRGQRTCGNIRNRAVYTRCVYIRKRALYTREKAI